MKVIIPLAGMATRMRPHTHTKAKSLLPLAGKTVLDHLLDRFKGLDVEEFIFIVGYLGDQIEEYVSANYDFPFKFVWQEVAKGQAHAIQLAREQIEGPVIILFGDTLTEVDFSGLAMCDVGGICYVKEVPDPRRFGRVCLEGGYITKFIEKAPTMEHKLALIGLYYVRDSKLMMDCIDDLIERDIKTKGEYFLADVFQLMIDRGAKFTAETVEVWEDCGKPVAFLHANRYLLDKNGSQISSDLNNSVIIPPVHIAENVSISNSLIGPHVSICSGAAIESSVIKDSVIDKGAEITESMLTGSLIGENACVQGSFRKLNIGATSVVGPALLEDESTAQHHLA